MSAWEIGFYLRIIASLCVMAAGFAAVRFFLDRLGVKSLLAYYAARVFGMFVLIVLFNQIPPDVGGWYQHGLWMIDGYFPGRDFLTPYHLGFNFLLAMACFLLRNPMAIVILFTLAEFLGVVLLYKALKGFWGEANAKKGLVLYLTSPIVFFQSFLGAQDETLVLLGIAVLLLSAIKSSKYCCYYIGIVFSVFLTKILAIMYLFPFAAIKRYKGVFVLLGVVGVYLAIVHLMGVNPFDLRFGRRLGVVANADKIFAMKTIGNIWFFAPKCDARICLLLLLIGMVLVALPVIKVFLKGNAQMDVMIAHSVYLSVMWVLVFSLFYKMTFASYLIPVLPFVCLLMVRSPAVCFAGVSWSFFNAVKDTLSYGKGSIHVLPAELITNIVAAISVITALVMLVVIFRACVIQKVLLNK